MSSRLATFVVVLGLGCETRHVAPESVALTADASPAAPFAVSGEALPSGLSVAEQTKSAGDVVAGMRRDFRLCYVEALKIDQNAHGSAMLNTFVGPTGFVVKVVPVNVDSLPPALLDCVVRRVSAGRFAPPGDAGVTLQIPIRYELAPPTAQ